MEFTDYTVDTSKNYEMVARIVNGKVFNCLGNLLGLEF